MPGSGAGDSNAKTAGLKSFESLTTGMFFREPLSLDAPAVYTVRGELT